MDPSQLKARIEQIHADLDQYTYYQLLNVSTDVPTDEIRRAYHRMALSLHPDRHNTHPDDAFRHKVYAIYKRITEGYRVLMDYETRREYDEGLERGAKRLIKTERPQAGPKRPELEITDPRARKFFLMGQDAQSRGDKKNARLNYNLAKGMIGEHPLIAERLAALDSD